MSEARAVILRGIRTSLGVVAEKSARERAYQDLTRLYTQAGKLSRQECTDLLLERLADYDAEVRQVREDTIAATIAGVLGEHGESVLLIPSALPDTWLPGGIEILRDSDAPGEALPLSTLTRAQAVLTPCTGAIAETGTILLEHGPAQGRRVLTLLPDHHICVLRASQIVETASEGLALLTAASHLATTTISGPSATADIEMTRIRGVHGPRRLSVLLVS